MKYEYLLIKIDRRDDVESTLNEYGRLGYRVVQVSNTMPLAVLMEKES